MSLIEPFISDDKVIQFSSLGSGSKGNGTLISIADTILLVDCGFSTKETIRRLSIKGLEPEQISAILVTHEHADHVNGVAGLANKFSLPVWLNKGTSLHKKCLNIKNKQLFNSHCSFQVGDIQVTPVTVPHDSREASQFTFQSHSSKLGLLTDVGHITNHIIEAYSDCTGLLLEFNYDHEMLIQGKYPFALKKRVSGDLGHLSNLQAAELLSKIDLQKLQTLVAMHMSEENNREEIVLKLLEKIEGIESVNYMLASQLEGINWHRL